MRLLEPQGGLSVREVFEFLTAEGQEWSHKVGVAGRADGSGKPSTRLLAVAGWVLKTDLARGEGSWEAADAKLRAERTRGLAARVWHESKLWGVFRSGDTFYPLTVCRELVTLRSLEQAEARFQGWTDMLRLALRVARDTGFGLDLNPANFGREPEAEKLYYLDDELYAEFADRQLAGAVASRIPEEPDLEQRHWRTWGTEIGRLLAGEPRRFSTVIDALLDYPLTEQFWDHRVALVEGARSTVGSWPGSRSGGRDLICVLADVHGNLPALEAVLLEAERLGATRYLFLGDAVGYGPHPKQCVARLADLPRAAFVKGNHDHCIGTRSLEWGMNGLARACAEWTLGELGETERGWLNGLALEYAEGDWLAVHGAPRDPNRIFAYVYDLTYDDNLQWLLDRQWRICLHGHSHVQVTYAELAGGPTRLRGAGQVDLASARAFLVNPGSVGQPRDGDPRAAFALFEPQARRWTPARVAYPVEQTLRDIEKAGLPPEAGRRLQTGA